MSREEFRIGDGPDLERTDGLGTRRLGCPNRFCDYQGDITEIGYCPSCCLTPREAEAMAGAGSGTPCYCSHPRDEHRRGVGACLMVTDGTRCGCGRFENPATTGTTVPVHLLPASTDPGPAWDWPDEIEGEVDEVEAGMLTFDPLPGDDPDLPRPTTATGPVGLDDVVTELREGLGTGIPRPGGGVYPGHLQEIEETLTRVEFLLRDWRRPSLLLTAGRCALVLTAACLFVVFVYLLIGASILAGVIP